MLACINGPRRPYAAMIKASVAICHSARFCSAFGSFHDVVGCLFERDELAAAGNGIGSSKRRLQPRVSCLFTQDFFGGVHNADGWVGSPRESRPRGAWQLAK